MLAPTQSLTTLLQRRPSDSEQPASRESLLPLFANNDSTQQESFDFPLPPQVTPQEIQQAQQSVNDGSLMLHKESSLTWGIRMAASVYTAFGYAFFGLLMTYELDKGFKYELTRVVFALFVGFCALLAKARLLMHYSDQGWQDLMSRNWRNELTSFASSKQGLATVGNHANIALTTFYSLFWAYLAKVGITDTAALARSFKSPIGDDIAQTVEHPAFQLSLIIITFLIDFIAILGVNVIAVSQAGNMVKEMHLNKADYEQLLKQRQQLNARCNLFIKRFNEDIDKLKELAESTKKPSQQASGALTTNVASDSASPSTALTQPMLAPEAHGSNDPDVTASQPQIVEKYFAEFMQQIRSLCSSVEQAAGNSANSELSNLEVLQKLLAMSDDDLRKALADYRSSSNPLDLSTTDLPLSTSYCISPRYATTSLGLAWTAFITLGLLNVLPITTDMVNMLGDEWQGKEIVTDICKALVMLSTVMLMYVSVYSHGALVVNKICGDNMTKEDLRVLSINEWLLAFARNITICIFGIVPNMYQAYGPGKQPLWLVALAALNGLCLDMPAAMALSKGTFDNMIAKLTSKLTHEADKELLATMVRFVKRLYVLEVQTPAAATVNDHRSVVAA